MLLDSEQLNYMLEVTQGMYRKARKRISSLLFQNYRLFISLCWVL